MKKNLMFSFITIVFFLVLFFSILNFLFKGVPLYTFFGLSTADLIYISKPKTNSLDFKIDYKKVNYLEECGYAENGLTNMVYRNDKHGFRNNKEHLFYNTDVVILGDSFGQSACINYPDDLTTKLIKKTGNKKILNLSVGGTGPFYQKEILKMVSNKNNTQFKTLIWLFYEDNDYADVNKHAPDIITQSDANFNKMFEKQIIFTLEQSKKKITKDDVLVKYKPKKNLYLLKIKKFFAYHLRGFATLVKYIKKYPDFEFNEIEYDKIVKDLSLYLKEKNIENKIIYYIPSYTTLAYNDINHPRLKNFNKGKFIVKEIANKYGFKFIDGSITFRKNKNRLDVFNYKLPTHFNKKGYDLLSTELSEILSY